MRSWPYPLAPKATHTTVEMMTLGSGVRMQAMKSRCASGRAVRRHSSSKLAQIATTDGAASGT
ncbi:hypothetical protein [Janibacter melonis]|uniref:hypothetical protein n=1 Tax=Janibacter melonis TaxID=262209 RepID=UPI002094546D|nr:hypothetical protein [Janibacter melonis]